MQKVIFLVDMNAFFISCEMTRNSDLNGKPAAVAGDPKKRAGIILAANYEARKYGVKTAMVLHRALNLCPDMIIVPPDHKFYRQKSRHVMELLSNYTPILEQNSIDEAWLDMTGTQRLFGTPKEAANRIMNDIKSNLGLWCSIGISNNKFLSKMASGLKKPLGITELYTKDIQYKLWPLPINKMHGVGEKTASKLNSLNIRTIGDLANYDKKMLYKNFGKYGIDLHSHANGIDYSTINPYTPDGIKSIGRTTTLPEDVEDIKYLEQILLALSEDIGKTARERGKKGKVVSITIKYSDFNIINRQLTLTPTDTTKDIYNAGCYLLRKNLSPSKAVRLIGITIKDFENNKEEKQLSFFDTASSSSNNKIDQLMDKLQNKYGRDKINRASQLIKKK